MHDIKGFIHDLKNKAWIKGYEFDTINIILLVLAFICFISATVIIFTKIKN